MRFWPDECFAHPTGADPKKGHHIYSDIDDTLIPACGHAGGMDRRFCKYRIYPGVVQLYKVAPPTPGCFCNNVCLWKSVILACHRDLQKCS